MRSHPLFRCPVAATLLLPFLVGPSIASTWTGLAAPDNGWIASGNWDSGVPGSGATAFFDNAGNGNTSISLGGATQPINSLFFTSGSAAAYTVGVTPGDTLEVDDGGSIFVDGSVITPQIIGANVLTTGSGILVENDVSNGGAGVGNGLIALTLGDVTIRNGGTLFVTNGTITTSTALEGDITESLGQPATLSLLSPAGAANDSNNNIIISGDNTYTGGTTIQVNTGNNGSIQINTDSPFGTGKVTTILQSTSVEISAVGGARTISNVFDLHGGIDFAGDNDIIMDGTMHISSNASRTLNNKMTQNGAVLYLGASPGSSDIYLGDPTSNGGDGVGRIMILTAQNGATMVINANFLDVTTDSAVRYGAATGGKIVINNPQTYTGETQLGSGSASLHFQHDYNVGDPSGPFGVGTLVANGGANIELVPTGGDRTIANPFLLKFGFTVNNTAGDNSSVTFSGPIKFDGSGGGRLIQNRMDPTTGGTLILGSAGSPNVFTLSDTPDLTVTFYDRGRTIINDTIEDALDGLSQRIPNHITIQNNTRVTTFNGDMNTDGNFTVNASGNVPVAIINGDRDGSGTMTTSGVLVVNGSKTGSGAVTVNSSGTLAGTGSIEGDVANSGTIAPGDETLTPGTLTLANNVTNLADSRWLIGLDGTTAGRVDIGGDLDLMALDNLDVLGSGTGPWIIATYGGSLMGTFDNVTPGFTVDYDTPGQIILDGAATVPGDYNNDGSVDAADYVLWRKDPASYGGDPDGYDTWVQNFGNSSSGSGSLSNSAAAPEPTTMALLMFALASLLFRVRKNSVT